MAFLNVVEIEAALENLAAAYPATTELIISPNLSHEARQSYILRVGRASSLEVDGVLILGGVHAREWVPPDAIVSLAADLLEAYELGSGVRYGGKSFSAADIRQVIEELNLFLYACVNPDGRHYSQTNDPLWRKNRRPHLSGGDCVGVDINRNFNFLWDHLAKFASDSGVSASEDPCNRNVYRGVAPTSEPEAKNVVWVLDTYPKIRWHADVHSAVPTILHSWGSDQNQTTEPAQTFLNSAYDGVRGRPDDFAYGEFIAQDDLDVVKTLANGMNDAVRLVRGDDYGVGQAFGLYPTSGASDDYAVSRHFADHSKSKVYGFTIECGHSFQPVWSEAEEVIREVSAALVAFCLGVEVGLPAVGTHLTSVAHDLTGDGSADIVGFGEAGTWVALNNGNGTFQPLQLAVDNFGYVAGGWRVEKHPRFLADLTGDGSADIVGFGEAGTWVALNNGNGTFQPLQLAVDNFGYVAGGWRVEKHPRFLADLTGDGSADIVGFGEAGTWVALNNGNGTFQPLQLAVDNFGYVAGGWRVEKHPRFLADLTGDGSADIVGFGEAGTWVALNNGNGTFQPLQLAVDNFGYVAGGWRVEKHPRFLADLTGDGSADIVGFGEAGTWVALNNGNGTFQPLQLAVDNFGYVAGGWRVEKHPRFLADLTGDGSADIVGFGEAGTWVALNNGNGTFQPLQLAVDNFGYVAGGWRVEKHPRFLADLTGDGSAEPVGFGEAGTWVALNNGNGTFQPLQLAVDNFGYVAGGWRVEKHPRFVAGPGSIGG